MKDEDIRKLLEKSMRLLDYAIDAPEANASSSYALNSIGISLLIIAEQMVNKDREPVEKGKED